MNTQPPTPPGAPDPLAVALSNLEPAPHGFDWNALMFAAGRASKGRALVFWRTIAGICALVAAGFALAYFTRPEVVSERERIVYRERGPAPVVEPPLRGAVPAPGEQPHTLPASQSEASPERPTHAETSDWTFDPPPEQGAAVRWLTVRSEVLTFGLDVLPDHGHQVPAPRREK